MEDVQKETQQLKLAWKKLKIKVCETQSVNFPNTIEKDFETLLRATAKHIFDENFRKTSDDKKAGLQRAISKFWFDCTECLQFAISVTLAQLVYDTKWEKFISPANFPLAYQDVSEIWNEEGWVILEQRLEILFLNKLLDQSALILEVLINKGIDQHVLNKKTPVKEGFHAFLFSFEKFVDYMTLYVLLWNQNKKYSKFHNWTTMMYEEVLKFLLQKEPLSREPNLLPKVKEWKKTIQIVSVIFQKWRVLKLTESDGSTTAALETTSQKLKICGTLNDIANVKFENNEEFHYPSTSTSNPNIEICKKNEEIVKSDAIKSPVKLLQNGGSKRKNNFPKNTGDTTRKEDKFKCKTCSKTYEQSSHCKRHERTHVIEKQFICGICDKVFFQNDQLLAHAITHGDKEYKCQLCTAIFHKRGCLKRHQITHTNVRQHKCEVCQKSFKDKCALRTHKKSHQTEKGHECRYCGKAFTLHHHLKRHFKTQHEEQLLRKAFGESSPNKKTSACTD